jgi:hypothetical protein
MMKFMQITLPNIHTHYFPFDLSISQNFNSHIPGNTNFEQAVPIFPYARSGETTIMSPHFGVNAESSSVFGSECLVNFIRTPKVLHVTTIDPSKFLSLMIYPHFHPTLDYLRVFNQLEIQHTRTFRRLLQSVEPPPTWQSEETDKIDMVYDMQSVILFHIANLTDWIISELCPRLGIKPPAPVFNASTSRNSQAHP